MKYIVSIHIFISFESHEDPDKLLNQSVNWITIWCLYARQLKFYAFRNLCAGDVIHLGLLQYQGTLECRRFTKTGEIEILEYIKQWWVSDFNQKKRKIQFNRRYVLFVANWSTHPLQYSNQNPKFHFNIIMKFSCNDQHIFSGRGAVVNAVIIELISIVKIWWDWKLN